MNNVQAFINRQLVNYNWRDYDCALRSLRCSKTEDFSHIASNDVDDSYESPVFVCKFATSPSNEHVLALANEDGEVAVHNTESSLPNRYSKVAHNNAIFDLAWMHNQMKFITVSGDHTAKLFDITGSDIVEERIFFGHIRTVKTVAFRRDDPSVFATGARDGAIFVWDTRAHYGQPDRIISQPHNMPNTPGSKSKFRKKDAASVSGTNSVTGLVFQDDMTLISCGASDGAIKVWDLRKSYNTNRKESLPKYVLPYMGKTTCNGFTNLLIDCSGVRLYANCMDHTIYCYNIATYKPEPVMTYYGHQNSSFYIKSSMSADGRYLISGSSDQNAYIWNTSKSTPLVSLVGHTAEVTCVAWCQKGNLKLVTCADDTRHKIWRVHKDDLEDWKLKGHGSVQEFTEKQLRTPSTRKRSNTETPHSQRKRSKICEQCQMLTPGSIYNQPNCENCVFSVSRSSKRSASQAELSTPKTETKRKQFEKGGPRCLFGNFPQTSVLATILEENQTVPTSNSFSPTANLPNFVVDGEAPHLNFSPQKKPDKDWLTKMRIEKSLRHHMDELSRPSSPKQRRLSDSFTSTSPRVRNSSPKPKPLPSNSNTNLIQSPLLKFFRITNNASRSTCERQCTTLSNTPTIFTDSR